jgi:hypothetical protein
MGEQRTKNFLSDVACTIEVHQLLKRKFLVRCSPIWYLMKKPDDEHHFQSK